MGNSSFETDHTFGRLPIFALPMAALVIIALGAALYTQDRGPSVAPSPTPTVINALPTNCEILETTDQYVVMKCDLSKYFHY